MLPPYWKKTSQNDQRVNGYSWLNNIEREGQYRLASRCYYIASLLVFDEANVARFDRTETNWQHLRRIQNSPLLNQAVDFLLPTRAFDRIWYGQDSATQQELQPFKSTYSEVSEAYRGGKFRMARMTSTPTTIKMSRKSTKTVLKLSGFLLALLALASLIFSQDSNAGIKPSGTSFDPSGSAAFVQLLRNNGYEVEVSNFIPQASDPHSLWIAFLTTLEPVSYGCASSSRRIVGLSKKF